MNEINNSFRHGKKHFSINKSRLKDVISCDLKLNIILTIACVIWFCVAPDWYEWFGDSQLGEWFVQCCSFLDERWFVNLPVCVLLTWLCVRWGCWIWKDEDVRVYRLLLMVFAVCLLFRGGPLFATISGKFDYKWLLLLLLIFPAIATIKNCFGSHSLYKKINEKLEETTQSTKEADNTADTQATDVKYEGFTLDYDEQVNTSLSLDKYADAIVHRLLHTDLTKNAYAIGITSKWGSGKTTFLDLLRKQIDGDAEIVNFYPWNCRTPEQVIEDFFATLRDNLSPKHSSLSRPIREYAKLISSVSLPLPHGISFDIQPFSENRSISKKKEELSNRLKLLQKRVVVFIDDLDRLDGDEVFEVLRLVRNTANLTNVIYIVAYDREYVENILLRKDISNSSDYLKKIFPVEVPLPKVEDYQIWEVLRKDLTLQSQFGFDFPKEFLNHFDDSDRDLILRALDDYRSVKHFVRLFMLDMSYLYEENACPKEHKLLDLFWIELLQVYDKTLYIILREDPFSLLCCDGKRYYLRHGICPGLTYEKNVAIFEGVFPGKSLSPDILKRLFAPKEPIHPLSICCVENYDKFFTLSVSPFKLSVSEYMQLLNCEQNPEDIVNNWIKQEKSISSILFMTNIWGIDFMTDRQLENYLHGMLCLYCDKLDEVDRVYGVRNVFVTNRFAGNHEQLAVDFVKDWFRNRINQGVDLFETSRLLNRLYRTTEIVDDDPRSEPAIPPKIIVDDAIDSLLYQLIESCLVNSIEATAVSVFDPSCLIGKVFANCCVTTTKEIIFTAEGDGEINSNKQVVWDAVVKHFSKMESKPSYEEFYKAIEDFLHIDNANTTTLKEEIRSGAISNPFDEMHLKACFGDDYKTKLEEFRNTCFVK